MVRHNAHMQKLADDTAREEDFFCVSYYGRIDGPCAFSSVGYEGPTYVYFAQLDGTKVNKGSINCKCLRLVTTRKSILTEMRSQGAIPPLS